MPKCKSCGASIKWVVTPSGKLTPIETKGIKVWVIENGAAKLVHGFQSHFANCPNADKHRRPKIKNQEIAPLTKREGGG